MISNAPNAVNGNLMKWGVAIDVAIRKSLSNLKMSD
jgi:hypothetical protein